MTTRLLRDVRYPQNEAGGSCWTGSGRAGPGPYGSRCGGAGLALGGIVGAAVLGAAPGLSQAATPAARRHLGHGHARATARQTIGGPKLSSRGVVVGYAARKAPRLPGIQASSFVVAEAGTGQVLAAKDPHG